MKIVITSLTPVLKVPDRTVHNGFSSYEHSFRAVKVDWPLEHLKNRALESIFPNYFWGYCTSKLPLNPGLKPQRPVLKTKLCFCPGDVV
jgi:hypothetical protein